MLNLLLTKKGKWHHPSVSSLVSGQEEKLIGNMNDVMTPLGSWYGHRWDVTSTVCPGEAEELN